MKVRFGKKPKLKSKEVFEKLGIMTEEIEKLTSINTLYVLIKERQRK